MARYKLVAFSNAVEGHDAEYNEWYDGQHMPDVLAIPGFVSAERFVCVDDGPHRYLAIYEIETDDLEGLLAEFSRRPGTDLMPISTSLEFASAVVGFWKPAA